MTATNMYLIHHEVLITNTPERCFDLARSIDFHTATMSRSKEVAVDGRISGLIELGEFVEWEATHLWVRQRLSSKITEMARPHYFVDEMVKGAFKSFRHTHRFVKQNESSVLMIDDFNFETPFGLFIHKYMSRLIGTRSAQLKTALEGEHWKQFLHE